MGISIGSASFNVSTLSNGAANRNYPAASTRVSSGEAARLNQEANSQPVQVGFGENTLSTSGAALQAIDSNFEVAQEIVPTVQELRERSRVVQSELRQEAVRPRPVERPEELRRRESVRPEADPAVQNFVQDTGGVENIAPAAAPEAPVGNAPSESATPTVATQRSDVATPGTTVPPAANRIDFFA